MPCQKKKAPKFKEEEKYTMVDFLKTLELDDYLNYPKTANYLHDQHYSEFDNQPRQKLIRLYKKLHNIGQCSFPGMFGKDLKGDEGESLAHLIFDNINLKADITIFQDCPELAKGIDTYGDAVYVKEPEKKEKIIEAEQNSFDWATKTYK